MRILNWILGIVAVIFVIIVIWAIIRNKERIDAPLPIAPVAQEQIPFYPSQGKE